MPTIDNILIESGTGTKVVAAGDVAGTPANTATTDVQSTANHVHNISDVIGLQAALNQKSDVGHTHSATDISDLDSHIISKVNQTVNLSGKADKIHTHTKSDISDLPQVAITGSYTDLLNKPTMGSAALLTAPASGNATSTQVVLGSDTRLTDARTALPHNHDLTFGDGTSVRIASKTTDTLHFVAGSNIVLGFDDATNSITIASTASGNGGTSTTSGTADKLTIPRNIRLAGGVSGSALFDGSSDITITATVSGSSHTHDISSINGLQAALDGKLASSSFSTFGTSLTKALDQTEGRALLGLGSIATRADTDFTPSTHVGTGGSAHALASTTAAGFMSALDKSKLDGITSGATNNYNSLINLPTLGTAAAKSTPVSGNAAATEVVLGSDTRLTDARTPLAHNHNIAIGDGSATRITFGSNERLDIVGGSNVSLAFDDTTNKLTISTTGVISGSVDSANKLTTARTITLDGGVTGSVSFDGSTNVTLTTAVSGTSHSHTPATALVAGFMSAADKAKLDGIASSATANQTDAYLLSRVNHTGEQAISTVTGLQAALDSKSGSTHTHSNVTTTTAGFMSAADKSKLDSIAANATATKTDAYLLDRTNHTGFQAISTVTGLQTVLDAKSDTAHTHGNATTTVAGFLSAADKAKLDGIAPNANANQTDAYLLSRVNHTGEQAISTVTGLQAALDSKSGSTHNHTLSIGDGTAAKVSVATNERIDIVGGSNVTIAYDDAANKLTINSTATISGAVDSANKLTTARTIALTGAITGSVAFDGTANVSMATTIDPTGHTHTNATTTTAGFMSALDKTKLDGIVSGATANQTDTFLLSRANHTGTQAISTVTGLQLALDAKADTGHVHSLATTTAAGFLSSADKIKLDGIAAGATANATDSQLRDRATHTGFQAISTITGLQTALDSKSDSMHTHNLTIGDGASPKISVNTGERIDIVGGSNVTIAYDDTTNKVTINSVTNVTGPVDSANKLATPRTITLSGGVSGAASFDGSSNITITSTVDPASHTHGNATTTVAGLLSAADKVKLDGITAGAKATQTDAYLLSRVNHTGEQAISTVTGLQTVLDSKAASTHNHTLSIGDGTVAKISVGTNERIDIVGGSNVTVAYDDVNNKLTIGTSGALTGSLTGNADTATKLATARTIALTGGVTGSATFDGSTNASIVSTVDPAGHIHANATTSVAGLMSALDKSKLDGIAAGATNNYNSLINLPTLGTAAAKSTPVSGNAAATEVVLGSDTRLTDARTPLAHNHDLTIGDGSTVKITRASNERLDIVGGSNVTIAYDDAANKLTINSTATISGAVDSANKLATARTIALTGGVTGSVAFDGSTNVSIATTVDPASHTHAAVTTSTNGLMLAADKTKLDGIAAGATNNYNSLINLPTLGTAAAKAVPATGNAATTEVVLGSDTRLTDARTPLAHNHTLSIGDGTAAKVSVGTNERLDIVAGSNVSIVYDDVNNKLTFATTGTLSGNADTATKLITPRTIALTGGVTGSTTFDGSANASIITTVDPNSHVHPDASAISSGLMKASDKMKLDGIATGATVNQTDAYLLSRANHSGTQPATSITGLATVATSGSYTDLINKPTITNFYVQTTEPASTINGDRWFNPDTGVLLTRYTSLWVEM